MPWERMQRAKASAEASVPFSAGVVPFCVFVMAAVVEEAMRATPGEAPPPQPAASSENAATAMTEATMSGERQGSIRFLSLDWKEAHQANLNVSPPRLKGC